MIIRQYRVGWLDVFCYLIGCEKTRLAAVIDPGDEAPMIAREAEELGLRITRIVHTHGHQDHTGASRELRGLTGADILMHRDERADAGGIDILLRGDEIFSVGELALKIIHTPGHTPGGICIYAEGNLFTGDTLFVGDSGRTDLPGGDRPTLGASLRKLMLLPDDTVVWPGHDYGPTPRSTIGWEKRNNVNAREYGFSID